jgi:hypothetical protein
MSEYIIIDNIKFTKEELSPETLELVEAISYLDKREVEVLQLIDTLRLSKKVKIDSLKLKVISKKAGGIL